MNVCYIDSSVMLRLLFEEPHVLELPGPSELISSELLRVEVFRVLDRTNRLKQRSFGQILQARTAFFQVSSKIGFIEIGKVTLETASQSFELPIKTLDAIHLSTAMLYRQEFDRPVTILTHDIQFAKAAQSMNFPVLGI